MPDPTSPPDDFDAAWEAAASGQAQAAPAADPDFERMYAEALANRGIAGPSVGGRLIPAENPNTAGRFLDRLGSNVVGGPLRLAALAARAVSSPTEAVNVAKEVGGGIWDSMSSHAKEAQKQAARGDKFGAATQAIGVLPIVGPMIAEGAESVRSGDYVTPAADVASLFVPTSRVLRRPANLVADLARSRAAARILALSPGADEVRAPKIRAALREHPEMVEQLGVHRNTETLARRAHDIHTALGQDVEGLQGITTPVPQAARVAENLRRDAEKYETTTMKQREVQIDTGVTDELGNKIYRTEIEEYPVTTSQFPAYGRNVRFQAEKLQELVDQFDGAPPFGELAKARAAAGHAGQAAFKVTAGNRPTVQAEAHALKRGEIADVLHDPAFSNIRQSPHFAAALQDPALAHLTVPELDEAFGRWKDMSVALRKTDNSAATATTREAMKLLMGRIGGKLATYAMGVGAGTLVGGGGAFPVMAGAALGHVLSDSTFWGTLRANTYSRIARAAMAGADNEAMHLILQAAAAYNASKEADAAQKRASAHRALQDAGKGVVGP